MREIDVREVKDAFDELLVSIPAGEEVVIMRGDTAVARLTKAKTPLTEDLTEPDARARAMDRWVRGREEITSAGLAFNVARTLHALLELGNDVEKSIGTIVNVPIGSLDGKTALELIRAGRTDDVLGYLQSFSGGWVG